MTTDGRPAPRSDRLQVDSILLDPENPRLVFTDPPSQLDLLRRLFDDEALDELMPSLRDNGFFEEEPIVVIPNDGAYPGGDWICVEGNRRLATVKLLLSADLRRDAQTDGWPSLPTSQLRSLRKLPCVIYPNRQQVLPFLGFRHITGAKKWEPFQKSRFIARLVDDGRPIVEIQDLIGDTTQQVKRLYQDFVVFKQIEGSMPSVSREVRRRFSLLEVTLNQRPIKDYLGMPTRLPSESVQSPLIPEDNETELRRVMTWVFGNDTAVPVVSESRDISKLAKVVEDPDARSYLIRTSDLEGAFEFAGGEREYLLRRLGRAERLVADAASIAAQYSDDESIQTSVLRLQRAINGLSKVVRP